MSRHYFNRADENQAAIIAALEAVHCKCQVVTRQPFDVVVGRDKRTYLLEIKNPAKPKADRQLTKAQQKFADTWPGHWQKVETVAEALQAVGVIPF